MSPSSIRRRGDQPYRSADEASKGVLPADSGYPSNPKGVFPPSDVDGDDLTAWYDGTPSPSGAVVNYDDLDRLKIRDLTARLHDGRLTGAVRRTLRSAGDVTSQFARDRGAAHDEALQWVVERLVLALVPGLFIGLPHRGVLRVEGWGARPDPLEVLRPQQAVHSNDVRETSGV